jgi:hypothetical protein
VPLGQASDLAPLIFFFTSCPQPLPPPSGLRLHLLNSSLTCPSPWIHCKHPSQLFHLVLFSRIPTSRLPWSPSSPQQPKQACKTLSGHATPLPTLNPSLCKMSKIHTHSLPVSSIPPSLSGLISPPACPLCSNYKACCQVLTYASLVPAPGPLHLLFPLPGEKSLRAPHIGLLIPQTLPTLLPTSLCDSIQFHFPRAQITVGMQLARSLELNST